MNLPRETLLVLTAGLFTFAAEKLPAIEETGYSLVSKTGAIEIRDYAPSIVAETFVEGDFEGAGNRAFRKLFKFISGDNAVQDNIEMTSPVTQQSSSEKIAMTSPVGQQRAGSGWAVSFMMPSSYTMETIPQPTDPDVVIREIPAFRAAVIRYSGFWSEEKFEENLDKLQSWLEENALQPAGEPSWARYDPPFKPWFLRRNEILIPLL